MVSRKRFRDEKYRCWREKAYESAIRHPPIPEELETEEMSTTISQLPVDDVVEQLSTMAVTVAPSVTPPPATPPSSSGGPPRSRSPVVKIKRDPRKGNPDRLSRPMKQRGRAPFRRQPAPMNKMPFPLMDIKFQPNEFVPPKNYAPRIPKSQLFRARAPNGEWVPVCFKCNRMFHLSYLCPLSVPNVKN